MLSKSNSVNSLGLSGQFLSEHARDYRQEPQRLLRYESARLDQDQIVYTVDTSFSRIPPPLKTWFPKVPNDLYLRFAALSDGTDEDILAFAGKWGPLKALSQPSQPISEWRSFSRLAAALLRAAAGMVGEAVCQNDWTIISNWAYENAILLRPDTDQEMQRNAIAASLNKWHNEPGIPQSLVKAVAGRIQIDPASVGLFSIIVTQLAGVISDTHRMAVCNACGRGFFPRRRPSQGIRQYCFRKTCKRAALQHASLAYRQRKKDGAQASR